VLADEEKIGERTSRDVCPRQVQPRLNSWRFLSEVKWGSAGVMSKAFRGEVEVAGRSRQPTRRTRTCLETP